jgi:hypothetical protein
MLAITRHGQSRQGNHDVRGLDEAQSNTVNPTQSNTNGRRDTGCAAPVIGTVNGNQPRHGKTALVSVSMLLTRLRQDENTREIPETSNPTSPDHRYSQPFDTTCETIDTLGTSNTVIGLAIGQPPAPATSTAVAIGQRRQPTNRHHQRAVSQSRRPTHQHQQRRQPSHHQRHQRQRPSMPLVRSSLRHYPTRNAANGANQVNAISPNQR